MVLVLVWVLVFVTYDRVFSSIGKWVFCTTPPFTYKVVLEKTAITLQRTALAEYTHCTMGLRWTKFA